MPPLGASIAPTTVAPFAGAWIEMPLCTRVCPHHIVAPFAGAWIEIPTPWAVRPAPPQSLPSRERGLKGDGQSNHDHLPTSLPTRERGLKFLLALDQLGGDRVAPFAGAWIEMAWSRGTARSQAVAPFAGSTQIAAPPSSRPTSPRSPTLTIFHPPRPKHLHMS